MSTTYAASRPKREIKAPVRYEPELDSGEEFEDANDSDEDEDDSDDVEADENDEFDEDGSDDSSGGVVESGSEEDEDDEEEEEGEKGEDKDEEEEEEESDDDVDCNDGGDVADGYSPRKERKTKYKKDGFVQDDNDSLGTYVPAEEELEDDEVELEDTPKKPKKAISKKRKRVIEDESDEDVAVAVTLSELASSIVAPSTPIADATATPLEPMTTTE